MTPSNKLTRHRNQPLGPRICRLRPPIPTPPPPGPPQPRDPPDQVTAFFYIVFDPFLNTPPHETEITLRRTAANNLNTYTAEEYLNNGRLIYTLHYTRHDQQAILIIEGDVNDQWLTAHSYYTTISWTNPPQYTRIQEWDYIVNLLNDTYAVLWT